MALGLCFLQASPTMEMIEGSKRDSTAFRCSIICSRLSQQGKLCQGFTGTVAHRHIPPLYLTYRGGVGKVGVATRVATGTGLYTWPVETSKRTPHDAIMPYAIVHVISKYQNTTGVL